ncbi:MAG: Tol-Pal system beta propeller repeat protein TolB [Desulfobacterales bacterium]|jgi:TolB protein|nr:Tol-Pal system beta propeller repeat protein TolB [Desulfobacterales bacterium]
MTKRLHAATGWMLAMVFLGMLGAANAQQSGETYQYIDIRNPFLRKIPLAVPLFKNLTNGAREDDNSRKAVDFMASSLDFTGYFKILDRGGFLFDPQKSGVSAADITFQNWTVVGAELLTTGTYGQTGDNVEMELRLFDTIKGRQILGKRYSGNVSETRKMILRFCAEVVFYLTGNQGIFNSRIAFVSTGSGKKEIYTCDFDGYNPTRLTYNDSISLFPSWSFDGQHIAYTSYKGGKPDIYIRSLADKRETVISNEGMNITPVFMPNRFELAATQSFSGDQEIYLLTGTGKMIKKLTNSRGSDVAPTWAPDGRKIAFVSNRTGGPQIYVLDLDTGNERRLTFEGKYNTQPSWSPRGDKIAYSSQVGGFQQVFVIGADGQNPVQLTNTGGDNESASWSPDGSLIVFNSTREGPSRLYVMTAFGTDQRRLLLLNGEQTNPKWSSGIFN